MPYSWIAIGVGAVLLIWIVAVFNSLVRKRNRVKNAWSDIDVQLKRRYDLVPNLVETVKGYKGYEASVFEKFICCCGELPSITSIGKFSKAPRSTFIS